MDGVAVTILLLSACGPPAAPERPLHALVADVEDGVIRRFDATSGADLGVLLNAARVPEGLLSAPLRPSGLALHQGALAVASFSGGEVLEVDPVEGAVRRVLYAAPPAGPALEEPADLASLGDRLVVLGNDSRNLLLLDTGASGDAGAAAALELGGQAGPPIRDGHGVTALPGGLLAVGTSPSDPSLGLVQLWDPSTGQRVADLAPYDALWDATDVAVAPDGSLAVADWYAEEVLLLDPTDGAVIEVLLGPGEVERPVALAWAPDGALLVVERHGLLRWTAAEGPVRLSRDLRFGRGLVLLGG